MSGSLSMLAAPEGAFRYLRIRDGESFLQEGKSLTKSAENVKSLCILWFRKISLDTHLHAIIIFEQQGYEETAIARKKSGI